MTRDWSQYEHGAAYFSQDRRYRYALSRVWSQDPMCLIVGLNPSTADESRLDPTLRRCIRFAEREGYGGFWMGNLFAIRATDPLVMKASFDPVGPGNDNWLADMARWVGSGNVIFAWGTHGGWLDRDNQVQRLLEDYRPLCFGLTREGYPRHPLYLPSTTPLVPYETSPRS